MKSWVESACPLFTCVVSNQSVRLPWFDCAIRFLKYSFLREVELDLVVSLSFLQVSRFEVALGLFISVWSVTLLDVGRISFSSFLVNRTSLWFGFVSILEFLSSRFPFTFYQSDLSREVVTVDYSTSPVVVDSESSFPRVALWIIPWPGLKREVETYSPELAAIFLIDSRKGHVFSWNGMLLWEFPFPLLLEGNISPKPPKPV